jgi:polyisoprenoid-binding protein YceI
VSVSDVAAKVGIALFALLVLGTPAEADLRRWTPVAGQSEVGFRASFPLGDFAGRTQEISGEVRADPSDLRQGISGEVQIRPSGLRTGDDARDRDMYKTLAIDRFPEIRFTVIQVEASFPSMTDRADVLLTVSGVMSIRGVKRPMAFPARVRLRDDKLWVRGEGELKMSEFGIRPPSRLFLDVKDAVVVSFDLLLAYDP